MGRWLRDGPDLDNVRRIDMGATPALSAMSKRGVVIDTDLLSEIGLEVEDRLQELEGKVRKVVSEERRGQLVELKSEEDNSEGDDDTALDFNLNSPEQVANFLFDTLLVGKGKNLKTTPGGQRISTGKKQLELLKEEHEVVQMLLDYRELAKVKSTYIDSLPRLAKQGEDGLWRVHSTFLSTRTATGRLASRKPNLQNIPVRTDLGARIRGAFIPTPGYKWVGADYGQIELRVLAHCAQDAAMIKVFREGGDLHTATAMQAFGIDDPDKVDKMKHRAPCKNVNFGIVYGLTASGLQAQLALSGIYETLEWCEEFIKKWFGIRPGVVRYMREQVYRVNRYGFAWDFMGRVRWVPEVYSVHGRIRAAGERQAGNMPIQAGAAEIMKLALGEVMGLYEEFREGGCECWPLITVHDELCNEVEEWGAELFEESLVRLMEGVCDPLLVDIVAEGKVSDKWEK